MLSAFPNWGGYSIDNDPSFGIYTTALNMIIGGGDGGDGDGGDGGDEGDLPQLIVDALFFVLVIAIVVILVAVGVMNIRKRRASYDKAGKEPTSDYWMGS